MLRMESLLQTTHLELSIFIRRVGNGWPELARASKARLERLTEEMCQLAEERSLCWKDSVAEPEDPPKA